MNSKRLYFNLSAMAGLVGVGMFLGHSLAQGTTNTALWVGGILIILAAVLMGMSISSRESVKPKDES